jgi:hypothetical protein
LRSRLEQLEAQVLEISSFLSVAESSDGQAAIDEDDSISRHFAELRLQPGTEKHVYFGPNSRFAFLAEYPELSATLRARNQETNRLLDARQTLLDDTPIATGFPFTVLANTDLQTMLPEKSVCNSFLARYLECCNSLFNIIDFDVYFCKQYPLLWSSASPPATILAHTFLMLSIAARSLNEGHWLSNLVSPDGLPGTLKLAQRWKMYGKLSMSQAGLLEKSSVPNIQAILLLAMLEGTDHVRWNLLGMVVNMARIAGLHRNPDVFRELGEKDRNLRRYVGDSVS